MSQSVYELLALGARYVFAGLMLLIVLRAWRITLVDSRRASTLRHLSPQTGISGELYEAAMIDGASRMQRIWHITLPGIRSTIVVLLIMNLALLLIGMVMDTGPALMILGPMLMPLTSALGVDPVHLGIIMTVNMAIGFVTPPFGVTLFVAAPIVGETPMALGKRAMPFIATFLVALLLITFVPQLSMCLL